MIYNVIVKGTITAGTWKNTNHGYEDFRSVSNFVATMPVKADSPSEAESKVRQMYTSYGQGCLASVEPNFTTAIPTGKEDSAWNQSEIEITRTGRWYGHDWRNYFKN